MPRGNFNEVSKGGGGLGFQEGYILIEKSYPVVFQFPPNAKDKTQSDAFCAMVWEGTKLNADWEAIEGDDGPESFEPIIYRMGNLDSIRPGRLEPKDFDNMDAEPEDLGNKVGTVGNSFFMEPDAKFHQNWGRLRDSLEKHAFKPEVLARGIPEDFVGLVAHIKTEKGEKYIAKKGKNAGTEQQATYLVCDRIKTYPWDKSAKKTATGATKSKANGSTTATTTAAGAPTNGAADADLMEAAKGAFGKLSDAFVKAVPPGKDVKRADFQKAFASELMRQKINTAIQKQLIEMIKDDERLMELAGELVDSAGSFTVGDGTVSFS